MSRPPSPTLSHRLEYLAYRAIEKGLRLLSLETTYRLGELLGRIIHATVPGLRAKVIRNLRFAFGDEMEPAAIRDLAARVFERTGANLLSSIRVPFENETTLARHLTIEGLDEVLASAHEGGMVAVSPHMGNWELLAQTASLAGGAFEVATHYRPLNNRLLNALVERRRKRRGLKLFAKRSSGHAMATFVKKGGFLAILADQRVGSRGFPGVFFGRPTTCSPLPDLMARRGRGRLFRLLCRTTGTARWTISLTPIPELSAQACANSLEEAWRSSPEDVFWFEERWRLQGTRRLDFLQKYPADHQVTRPLRFVHLGAGEPSLDLPASLVNQERRPLDFTLPDPLLREHLREISELGATPVDLFLCPPAQLKRMTRLSGKILVLSSRDRYGKPVVQPR
jgi:KDO2-lipid IV(A) lauroyltransferase